jgi:hypothetical protein
VAGVPKPRPGTVRICFCQRLDEGHIVVTGHLRKDVESPCGYRAITSPSGDVKRIAFAHTGSSRPSPLQGCEGALHQRWRIHEA